MKSPAVLVSFFRRKKPGEVTDWMKDKEHRHYISRKFRTYEVYLSLFDESKKDLYNEVLNTLSAPMDCIVEKLFDATGTDYFTLGISENSVALYGVFTWFHGMHRVNKVCEKIGIKFVADYEGEVNIATEISRPITAEKIKSALEKLLMGAKLYEEIRVLQATLAEDVARTFVELKEEPDKRIKVYVEGDYVVFEVYGALKMMIHKDEIFRMIARKILVEELKKQGK